MIINFKIFSKCIYKTLNKQRILHHIITTYIWDLNLFTKYIINRNLRK